MAVEIHIRKLKQSYQYDFKLPGRPRERRGGYRTKRAAFVAGDKLMKEQESGVCRITFEDAYHKYMEAKKRIKDRAKDTYRHHWKEIGPRLGHILIKDIDTSAIDDFKAYLPDRLGPRSVNHHLTLVKAVLRFMWKRGKLAALPYIEMEKCPEVHRDWYDEMQRDRLLAGMMQDYPSWYLFFYITCRLGLRRGEVYALRRSSVRHIPPMLVVDTQVQVGTTKERPAMLTTRKNNAAYTLKLSQDIMDAIQWHIDQGYTGEEFLFSKTGKFPVWLDSHQRPLRNVQRKLGLPLLSHHAIGRHSVASQAVNGGTSLKSVQSQLGHKSISSTNGYAHMASNAQLKVMEDLRPVNPPHLAGKMA